MSRNDLQPYQGDEQYIFISYAHKDEVVLKIIEQMINDGYRVWFDNGIDPGTEWDDSIASHIERCSHFIAFISENYLASENCRDELNVAREWKKNRLLIYLQNVVLPRGMFMRLNRLQSIHKYTYTNENDFFAKLYSMPLISDCKDKSFPATRSFGAYLTELRIRFMYSQAQIANFVGVTIETVKKWESDKSIPRYNHLTDLARIYGTNIEKIKKLAIIEGNFDTLIEQKESEAWNGISTLFKDKYNLKPPMILQARFDTERTYLENNQEGVSLKVASTIAKTLKEKNEAVHFYGSIGSSYISWLLGITSINPALPHFICPSCHRFELSEKEDIWDDHERHCKCGSIMIRDGHNLPFVAYNGASKHLEIRMNDNTINEAKEAATQYLSPLFRLIKCDLTDTHEDIDQCERYIILPNNITTEGIDSLKLTTGEYYHQKYQTILFMKNISAEEIDTVSNCFTISPQLLEKGLEKIFEPDMSITDQEFQRRTIDKCENIKQVIIEKRMEICFSLLVQVFALIYGTGIWEDNGEILIKENQCGLMDLAATRDSVWLTMTKAFSSHQLAVDGMATSIMNNIRRGKGLGDEEKRILAEVGLPDWYIRHISMIRYQFPKSSCIESVVRILGRI